MMINDDDDGV